MREGFADRHRRKLSVWDVPAAFLTKNSATLQIPATRGAVIVRRHHGDFLTGGLCEQ